MVEAARLGQLSKVRKLLDRGTATVEDADEVSVCVCAYMWACGCMYACVLEIQCNTQFIDGLPGPSHSLKGTS